ncbi:MAG: glycosyltransferase family 2 protein [Pseudomonadota bacterium]
MATEPQLIVRKQPQAKGKVALFAMIRNEIYFLPHLLDHYRKLGINEFWFLDDRSDDGSAEYLRQQPDCGIVHSNLSFGDKVGEQPFGAAVKTLVPRALLMNRWVLTVDADEFLILPPPYDTVPQLAQALEANKLKIARALMMDFFPAKLRGVEQVPMTTSPFEMSPNCDPWTVLEWPDQAANVSNISVMDGIRPRMLERLQKTRVDLSSLGGTYRFANVNKVPLFFWEGDARALSGHRNTIPASDKVQLVLAHFKFYPGYEARIAEAVEKSVHWQGAIEYRFLDLAVRNLADWPLQGPVSREYRSRQDLADTGLLYSRLN